MICAECTQPLQAEVEACPACGRDPRLVGRYWLLGRLGSGNAGLTYRGRSVATGEEVAIKELALRAVSTMKQAELFEREARVLRQLEHAGVPRFVESFEAGVGRSAAYYLVEELIHGHTLVEELAGHRPRPIEALAVAAELLEILIYLHGLSPPVVHRDIKPSNVMRREGKDGAKGRLVLIDFGAVLEAAKDPLLGGSTVAGTFGYMAPEQLRGIATPASDLYALGVLTVHLLTGLPPEKLLDATNRVDWQTHLLGAHPAILGLLRTWLELDPEKRAKDARVAAAAIQRVMALVDSTYSAPGLAVRGPGVLTDPELEARLRVNLQKTAEENERALARTKYALGAVGVAIAISAAWVIPNAYGLFGRTSWIIDTDARRLANEPHRLRAELSGLFGRVPDCLASAQAFDFARLTIAGTIDREGRIDGLQFTEAPPWSLEIGETVLRCVQRTVQSRVISKPSYQRPFVVRLHKKEGRLVLDGPPELPEDTK